MLFIYNYLSVIDANNPWRGYISVATEAETVIIMVGASGMNDASVSVTITNE